MRTVRAFGKELTEVDTYAQKTDHVLNLAKKEAVMRAGFFGVVSACVTCGDVNPVSTQVLHTGFCFLVCHKTTPL